MDTDKTNDVIYSIDKKLEQLEKEREEIEKKYGIDENILNSFSFTDKIIQFPPSLTQPIPKPKRVTYENITKIKNDVKIKEPKVNYKTPELLIDSLKYEPNINDLKDKETFEPTYTSLNTLKSKPTIPQGYDVTSYIEDDINLVFENEILH